MDNYIQLELDIKAEEELLEDDNCGLLTSFFGYNN
jgi:hypothetical protein